MSRFHELKASGLWVHGFELPDHQGSKEVAAGAHRRHIFSK
jgi:hypothetical protein